MPRFPPFEEIREFIMSSGQVSVNEIKNHFKMTGTGEIYLKNPKGDNIGFIVAFDINRGFYDYLRRFMKEEEDLYCGFAEKPDTTEYKGTHTYVPFMMTYGVKQS
ncbi:hypothetical protein BMW23_1107 [Bodo saltans virus]|jgi:hypothetical protein|uniref:Uncharacterized protein n=1 Tax=Bodo saltans virus TaxID=2024608 RepID=A0A2H4UW54_9VIRU|nr:hypothetical protein QJ851_gp1087 [Bodo saltans virus]ATZ81150.1 hypothetical protein BMW23_1107 [Bodo saltans virus]